MRFEPSKEMKITILPEQEDQLCTKETIKEIFARDDKGECTAFDIYYGDVMIGFAMFCEYPAGTFFLWNYAIDASCQNRGLGKKALREVLDLMVATRDVKEFTTTYVWGNEHAKRLYESVGFVETDMVEEDGYKEVNMKLVVRGEKSRPEEDGIRLCEDADVSRFLPRIEGTEMGGELREAVAENDEDVLTVCLGGETVGLAVLSDDRDEGFLYVFIFPEHRCRGYGAKAAELAVQRLAAPEMREIVTAYLGGDERAERFASKCGFAEHYSSALMEYRGEKFDLPPLPVRQYEDADYTEAFTVAAEAFHRMRLETGRFPDSAPGEPTEEGRREWAETARERWVYVADGEIVGVAHVEGPKLDSASVRISRQGEGFGRALVKFLVNHALEEGKEAPYLWCVVGNDRARRLYDSLGFTEKERWVFAGRKFDAEN